MDDFAKAGASLYNFHIEATERPLELIEKIRETGMKVGIAVKPKTPIDLIYPFADKIDLCLVMTVEPGFGGQKFMHDCMPKVKKKNHYLYYLCIYLSYRHFLLLYHFIFLLIIIIYHYYHYGYYYYCVTHF